MLFRYFTFDLVLFEAVNFAIIVEKVSFGLVCFGLVWIEGFGKQTK